MGRVKLQIKKIENTTNRQVTFSKRRNGLIKKAYELSVLCDVDVALIMFSPSGRLSVFSGGNKSIEDVIARYVNLPEHERGRLHSQEYLQKAIGKLKSEADKMNPDVSALSADSRVEMDFQEIQEEIMRSKSQLEDMEKRLRMYEGDPWEIETPCEAEYREQILVGMLKQVRARQQILEETYTSPHPETPVQTSHLNWFNATNASNNLVDWLSQRDHQVPALNFSDHTELLPLRDDQTQQPPIVNMLPAASLTLPHTTMSTQQPNMFMDRHGCNSPNAKIEDDPQLQQPPEFGQIHVDVNLSSWTQPYATGNDPLTPGGQPREGALLELFLSQLAPVHQNQIENL